MTDELDVEALEGGPFGLGGVPGNDHDRPARPRVRAAKATPSPWLPADAVHDRPVGILGHGRRHRHQGATDLERPRRLKGLELEHDVGPEQGTGDDGCGGQVADDDATGPHDVVGVGFPYGAHCHPTDPYVVVFGVVGRE